jgi:hypothetical protein
MPNLTKEVRFIIEIEGCNADPEIPAIERGETANDARALLLDEMGVDWSEAEEALQSVVEDALQEFELVGEVAVLAQSHQRAQRLLYYLIELRDWYYGKGRDEDARAVDELRKEIRSLNDLGIRHRPVRL